MGLAARPMFYQGRLRADVYKRQVREKLPTPELRDETTPAHVISAATGIITHMEVLEGQPSFQEGDTVLEGEVLILSLIHI